MGESSGAETKRCSAASRLDTNYSSHYWIIYWHTPVVLEEKEEPCNVWRKRNVLLSVCSSVYYSLTKKSLTMKHWARCFLLAEEYFWLGRLKVFFLGCSGCCDFSPENHQMHLQKLLFCCGAWSEYPRTNQPLLVTTVRVFSYGSRKLPLAVGNSVIFQPFPGFGQKHHSASWLMTCTNRKTYICNNCIHLWWRHDIGRLWMWWDSGFSIFFSPFFGNFYMYLSKIRTIYMFIGIP